LSRSRQRSPSTLVRPHPRRLDATFLVNRCRKPSPKGPSLELIHVDVEMKQRNPNCGCPRIAQQIALAFHIQIDKDVVRRNLAHHYLLPPQDPLVQPLAYGSVKVRIVHIADPLAPGGHGLIYPPDYERRAEIFFTIFAEGVRRFGNLASALPTISFCLKAIPRKP
jgi:hypothetical protein